MWLASYQPRSMAFGFIVYCVSFYFFINNRVANNLINMQSINRFDKSLQQSPPPTTCPRLICIGSAIIVESEPLEAADACHGGDSCVLWEFLGSRQNLIAVKLLTLWVISTYVLSKNLVVWRLGVLASTVCHLVYLLDELFVGITYWFVGSWTLPYILYGFAFIIYETNWRLHPDLYGLMPSYLIVRRQGFCYILVTANPSRDLALVGQEMMAIVAVLAISRIFALFSIILMECFLGHCHWL